LVVELSNLSHYQLDLSYLGIIFQKKNASIACILDNRFRQIRYTKQNTEIVRCNIMRLMAYVDQAHIVSYQELDPDGDLILVLSECSFTTDLKRLTI
jgi:hypothetical protein